MCMPSKILHLKPKAEISIKIFFFRGETLQFQAIQSDKKTNQIYTFLLSSKNSENMC